MSKIVSVSEIEKKKLDLLKVCIPTGGSILRHGLSFLESTSWIIAEDERPDGKIAEVYRDFHAIRYGGNKVPKWVEEMAIQMEKLNNDHKKVTIIRG